MDNGASNAIGTESKRAEIAKVRDMILETLGDTCEKIILFGSWAYGTPRAESDIDIYVVLKDGSKTPILAMEDISVGFGRHDYSKEIDVLANYKSRFEHRSAGPTLERTIANKGVVLYAQLAGQPDRNLPRPQKVTDTF